MLSSYILFTALGAQFIFILINWYFFRRKEYGFYLAYILAVSAYYLNNYSADENGMVNLFSFSYYTLYPDKILAILSYTLYIKFGSHFVEAGSRYPRMNGIIMKAENILIGYVIFDIAFLMVFNSFDLESGIFLFVNICLSVFLGYVFWNMIRRNEILDRFIIYGSIFYAISATLTIWIGHHKTSPEASNFMIVLQIGTLTEMIFLNAGIVYKSKMLYNQTIQSQQLLIGRYKENQNLLLRIGSIREKISRDLHDDVGATLSSIKAYSEILKENPGHPAIPDLITSNSAEMIERLEIITWSTNPENDHVVSLMEQMQKYAHPLCHSKGMMCAIESVNIRPDCIIPGEIRQNIFLIFKESLNNMIKYAEASNYSVRLLMDEQQFLLTMEDDGIGFGGVTRGSGRGLKNMKKRAEEMKGVLEVTSIPNQGTSIILRLPFPFQLPNSWDKKEPAFH